MMRREGGRVLIDICEEDYGWLMIALAFATGASVREVLDRAVDAPRWCSAARWLRLANSINEGNPDWTPYAVDEPKGEAS